LTLLKKNIFSSKENEKGGEKEVMISMYKWQKVKAVQREGKNIRKIMRIVKISRNTVRKYMRSTKPPKFKKRSYTRMLDKYKEEISQMLSNNYIGTRIYEELLKLGYKGCLSTVHKYISWEREEEKRQQKVSTRVETAPGEQMQYDWKEWILKVAGKKIKIYLHEVILSYSRKKFYSWSLSITEQDVMRALVEAINYFGGAAKELLIDNAKQLVITHRTDGIVRYNENFLKFCGLYGIEPKACKSYRARTKGKVERSFYYIQEHFLRGLEVKSLKEFDSLLLEFTETYNYRKHSSIKESPEERFKREKDLLMPPSEVEIGVLFELNFRKVSNDGYISWEGNFYPVPMKFCLKEIMIESIFGRVIRIYDMEGNEICKHWINPMDKGLRPIHPEHEQLNKAYMDKRKKACSKVVNHFIETFGDIGERFIKGLRQATGANTYWHLSEILACRQLYKKEEVKDAIKQCDDIGAYHKNSVIRLLEGKQLKAMYNRSSTPLSGLSGKCIKRDLSAYAELKGVGHE